MNHIYRALLVASALLRLASAECQILKRGLSRDLLLTGGTVLTVDGALGTSNDSINPVVFVQEGKIAYVGDICGLGPSKGGINGGNKSGSGYNYDDASIVDCPGSVISPGFINTHDHLDYATVAPLPDIGERPRHRHDWRVGARGNTMREVAVNGSAVDAAAWGELRHVFSGTTSVIGGGMAPGLARNLDFPDGLEDSAHPLPPRTVVYDTFPLRDSHGILRTGDCDYGAGAINSATAALYHRYIPHVGEGIDPSAANEFSCLSNVTFDTTPFSGSSNSSSSSSDSVGGGGLSTDIIAANVALIHALGLSNSDFDLIAARDAMIVWSPRSNMALYGTTLNITYLLAAGITVALGTDWLPSGSASMGREAVCAAAASKALYGADIPAKTLWEMATVNAARVAGFEDELGSLGVGKLADIVIFSGDSSSSYPSSSSQDSRDDRDSQYSREEEEEEEGIRDPYAQAIFAPQSSIELVLRAGKILLVANPLKDLTSTAGSSFSFSPCEDVVVASVSDDAERSDTKKLNKMKMKKTICVADELGMSFSEFEASLRGVYPAVLPEIPPLEPSCI